MFLTMWPILLLTLKEQQIMLKGAHDTLVATMDHLAVANLLDGNQKRAAEVSPFRASGIMPRVG